MATFTLEELKKRHPEAQLKVLSMADIQRQGSISEQIRGNQFDDQPTSFLGKARNFATDLLGGKYLAEGAGKGIAAPQVQSQLGQAEQESSDIALALQKRIIEKRNNGEDVTRLQSALDQLSADQTTVRDAQTDFTSSLPSNKQVIGSSVRLAGTLAGGSLLTGTKAGVISPAVPGLSKAFALGKATTFGGGALRGLGAGATAGAIEGGIQGAGIGAEQNQTGSEIATTAAIGAGTGAAFGGVVGAIGGGVAGKVRGSKEINKTLDYVTPTSKELTPTEYKRALEQGRITPKTATEPAKYVLSQPEKNAVSKYPELITKDPVKTTVNISDKIGELDDDVGSFLRKNNGIYSKGELRNSLTSGMEEVTDVNVDEARLQKLKETLVNNFVDSVESNDMESLWIARKNFDSKIETAFKGSPSLQKEAKRALRNAVQDFISERTPSDVYGSYMKDMSELFRLRDLVVKKATKERALSTFAKWAKENPKKAKALGWGALIGGGAIASEILGVNPLTRGSGSSGG